MLAAHVIDVKMVTSVKMGPGATSALLTLRPAQVYDRCEHAARLASRGRRD